jgi:hypothetical protein
MPTYTDEPAILGIAPLIAQIASSYLDHPDSKRPPSDVAMKVLKDLEVRSLQHFFGELLAEDAQAPLTGMTNQLSPRGTARLHLKVYVMPYVYEQPNVVETMRDRGHSGQLPKPLTRTA